MNTINRFFTSGLMLGAALAGSTVFADTSPTYTANFGTPGTPGTYIAFNYGTSLVFPKFDPSLGTLNSVTFNLQGAEHAEQDVENRGGTGSTIVATSTGTMTLFLGASPLVVTVPTVVNTFNATAFDTFLDFAGTSGASFTTDSTTTSNFFTDSAPGDLTSFTGVGNISLPITAAGSSSASGGGNTTSSFTQTGATFASVTYHFTPTEVPEASTYGSIGAVAIVGFLGYRRSRKGATTAA